MSEKANAVWITGANSGIGKSITRQFAENNINCIASARREDALNKLLIEFPEIADRISVYPIDLAESKEVSNTSKEILKFFDVDCLINNAGITSFTKAEEDSIELIESIINVNLLGAISTINSLLPHFIERNGGTIINILSVVVNKIFTNSSAYSAAKAGLLAYANVLREEVREYNIRVINVIPGATRTPIWPSEMLNSFAGKMMLPDDVAKIVLDIYKSEVAAVPEEVTIRPISGDI